MIINGIIYLFLRMQHNGRHLLLYMQHSYIMHNDNTTGSLVKYSNTDFVSQKNMFGMS